MSTNIIIHSDLVGVEIEHLSRMFSNLANQYGAGVTVQESTSRAGSNKDSKRAAAAVIYVSMADSARKDVVAAFQDQAGLTEGGAKTYYQNFYSKKWSV